MKKIFLLKISVLMIIFLFFITTSCNVSKISLDSISPESRALHMPAFTLTVTGAGFDQGAEIVVGEKTMVTNYVSSTELNCIVPSGDLSVSSQTNNNVSGISDDQQSISVFVRNSNGKESEPIDLALTDDPAFLSPSQISSAVTESYNPKIAVDGNKNLYVAFERYDSSLEKYYVSVIKSSDKGTSWSSPVDIFTSDEKCYNPEIAISSDNRISVVFYMIRLYYSCSTDQGETWSSPVSISDDTNYPLKSDIAVDYQNGINILWVQNISTENHIYFRRSSDGGDSFSIRVDASEEWDNYGTLYEPSLDTDDQGGVFAAWKAWPNYASRYASVYTNYSLNSGVSWGSQDTRFGVTSSPDIESSPNGRIFLVLSSSYLPFQDRVVLFKSNSEKTAWSYVTTVTGEEEGYYPKMKIDSIGNIDMIFLRSLKYYFTRSVDDGESWSTPSAIVENASAIDMVIDSEGNIYIVYELSQSGGMLAFTRS